MKEQGGSDEEMRAQGPYPSTAASGLGTPDAPPADIGQQVGPSSYFRGACTEQPSPLITL
jgi:hypothetical protein